MTAPIRSGQIIEDCWNRIGVRGDRSCGKLAGHTHCRNCDTYADAARNIMQRALPAGYRQEWAQHFAQQEQDTRSADQSVLVFRIGREWLALPTRLSVTIAEAARPHCLPHRGGGGSALLGIVNVKGRLYPCMSLAALLGTDMEEAPLKAGQRAYARLLVMQLGQHSFALPVQDLHGIHRYAQDDLQALPATSGKAAQRYLTGILPVEDLRVGCLDAELLGYSLASHLK